MTNVQGDAESIQPQIGSTLSPVIWIGFSISLVAHLAFLYFVVLPGQPPAPQEQEQTYDMVQLTNIPVVKPPVKPPEPKETPKPSANQQSSAPRKIMQSTQGDASVASVRPDIPGAADGDLAGGTGTGPGNSLGTGSAPAPEPIPAPEPAPPPPPPPAGPLVKARPLAKAQPVYPPEAREAGQQGTVIVKAYIDKEGNVSRTEIKRSSGFPALDQAAMEAVRVMRFQPANRGGQPEESVVGVPVTFEIG